MYDDSLLLTLSRRFRFSLIRHAVLGEDSFRFAAMLGMKVFHYQRTLLMR